MYFIFGSLCLTTYLAGRLHLKKLDELSEKYVYAETPKIVLLNKHLFSVDDMPGTEVPLFFLGISQFFIIIVYCHHLDIHNNFIHHWKCVPVQDISSFLFLSHSLLII